MLQFVVFQSCLGGSPHVSYKAARDVMLVDYLVWSDMLSAAKVERLSEHAPGPARRVCQDGGGDP